ncbi:MAG: hypothetical protein K6G27_01060 [Lachnospiraceae bacterium]|nr:hypothetical protein [Lachnospiraceae bacterium]
MQLKSYLRGFGCGLFISAVLMGIAMSYSRKTMTDEEVKLRAAELGMVEEDSVLVRPSADSTPTPVVQLNPDPVEQTEKVTVPSDTTGSKTTETEEVKEDTENQNAADKADPYENEDRLAAMGMNASSSSDNEEAKEETKEEEKEEAKAEVKEEAKEEVKEEVQQEVKQEAEEEAKEDTKSTETYTLEISKGASSPGVAGLLQKSGLVDNAADFDDYLCKNGYDKRIQNGVFKIPAGAGYEEIAKIITRSR